MQHYTVMRSPVVIDRDSFFGNDTLHEIFTQHLLFTPTKLVTEVPPEIGNKIIDTDRLRSRLSIGNASVKSSTHSYIDFRRKANESLIEINNNLSCLIQETFKGIDSICNKVRDCLGDGNTYSLNKVASCDFKSHVHPSEISVAEDKEEFDVIEEVSEKTAIEENESETSVIIEERSLETIEEVSKEPVKFFTEITPATETSEVDVKIKSNLDQIKKAINDIEQTDFDKMMDEMVENVHSKIEESFSSLHEIYKTGKEMCDKVDKPIKKAPLLKKNEEKITNLQRRYILKHEIENCISNDLISNNIPSLSALKNGILPKLDYSPADVYRKRAFTDLNEKLKAQLEANDSLLFFQKLMERTRRRVLGLRPCTPDTNSKGRVQKPKCQDLDNFSVAFSKFNKITDISKKFENSLWFNAKPKTKGKKGKEAKKKPCKASASTRNVPGKAKIETKPRTLLASKKGKKIERLEKKSSACTCTMVITNNEPLNEADKCKLHFMRAKNTQMSKKLKYLDILDDITTKDVLPIKSEYPRKDDQYVAPKNVKETYLYKLMYGKKKDTKRAWSQLFEPSIKCSTKNCVDCQNVENNCDDIKKPQTPTSNGDEVTTNLSKKEIIRKLSKYMYDVENKPKNNYTVTVMPVHVFYDNKLPLNAMKEGANFKRAEWQNPQQNKTMKVVIDCLPKSHSKPPSARPEVPIFNMSGKSLRTGSVSPKNFAQWCNPFEKLPSPQHPPRASSQQMTANPPTVKQPLVKSAPTPVKSILKQEATVKQDPSRTTKPTVKVARISHCDYLNLESSIRPKMSEEQRRLQAHKYGKAVSQKLVDFVENQKPPYELPVPAYAKPKNLDEKLRQKNMLHQLRNLKQRNDSIQVNIQKAIEVIETKMTDILSRPSSSNNLAAFNEMEKEITDVLNMMKTQNKKTSKPVANFQKEKKKNVAGEEEDVERISEELFSRLAKILESTTACSSTNSSRNSVRAEKVYKRKLKPTKTLSTTTTMSSDEEKVVISSYSPKYKKRNEEISLDRPAGDQSIENIEEHTENVVLSDRSQGDCPTEVKHELMKEIEGIIEDLETKEQEAEEVKSKEEAIIEEIVDESKEEENVVAKQDILVAEKSVSCNETTCVLSEKILTDSSTEPIRELLTDSSSYKETTNADTETTTSLNDNRTDKNLSSPSEYSPESSPKEEIETAFDSGEAQITEAMTENGSSDPLDSKNFCENVDKIIMRVETIYNTLNEFEEETTRETCYKKNIPIFREYKNDNIDIDTETFLTPFMKEIKDRQKGDSRPESPRKSASYFNVLSFLDTLTDDVNVEKPIEVHTSRLVYFARTVYYPVTYHMTCVTNFLHITAPPRQSCLKKCEETKKTEKKVSFLLNTEDKDVQACVSDNFSVETITEEAKKPTKDESQNTETYISAQSQTIEETRETAEDVIVQENQDSSEKTSDNVSTLQHQDSSEKTSEGSTLEDTLSCQKMSATDSLSEQEKTSESDIQNVSQMTTNEDFCEHCGNLAVCDKETEENSSDKDKKDKKGKERENSCNNWKGVADRDLDDSEGSFYDSEEIKVFRDESPPDSLVHNIIDNKLSDIYEGIFGKQSLEIVRSQNSVNVENRSSSLEKLLAKSKILIEENDILQPLKNVDDFLDVELLKKAVRERQELRLLRRKSSGLLLKNTPKKEESSVVKRVERDNVALLKGFYAIVYIIVFTALNLEYKCV